MGSRNQNDDLLQVSPGAITEAGALREDLSQKLQAQWKAIIENSRSERTSIDFERDYAPDAIPVVLLSRAFAPEHSHGSVIGNRKVTVSFAMVIPAILGASGVLEPDPENPPWIRREFLSPTATDSEEIPVVGSVDDFDRWLDRHPYDATKWAALFEWREAMWAAVAHGNVPEGFVEIEEERICASKTERGAGRHILKLYDALLAERDRPALLTNTCGGRVSIEIGRAERLREVDAARGAMGATHGLATSQTDAVIATALLAEGEVQTVNGPPGTGKTTLLQSVIATETVRRAMRGGDPAIIVGCSTNNQAVTNINRALNAVLAENRSGEKFSWARRWVPNTNTYGLYLPIADRAGKAKEEGFAVAVKSGSAWTGFPEKESDPAHVAEAVALWMREIRETYEDDITDLQVGLKRIREDLESLLRITKQAGVTVRLWDRIETWWQRLCEDVKPEVFIRRQAERFRNNEAVAEAALAERVREGEAIRATHNDAVSAICAEHDDAKLRMKAISEQLGEVTLLTSRIEVAGASRGFVEIAATFLPFLRQSAAVQQHNRRLTELRAHEQILFQSELDNHDASAWSRRADSIVAAVSRDLQGAHEICSRMVSAKWDVETARNRAISGAEGAISQARAQLTDVRATNERDLDTLNRRLSELRSARQEVKTLYNVLRCQPATEYADDAAQLELPDWLAILDRTLDVSIRHEMFQKSMRYWEGRWIVEAQRICHNSSERFKNGATDALVRFRRWCMLTPCLVSTLHSLPNRMRFSRFMEYSNDGARIFALDFLLGGIDLLIMDEAGQIGPHVGMAAFALATRALVVGDIHQLEPVTKIPAGMDRANASKCGLAAKWSGTRAISPHMLSESTDGFLGSVMRVAQEATAFSTAGADLEPGIFLSEHRRCDPSIIAYCNDLVYSGRLQALSVVKPKAPEMRAWGWAHVRGHCEKRGTSRANEREAQAIAGWIAKRSEGEQGWLAAYKRRDGRKFDSLDKVVAVVTPFAAQAAEIQKALKSRGPQFSGITVGTVTALQGSERPIIIFSPTYTDGPDLPSTLFFNRKPNLLNVAVSRAEDSFVVIGDMRVIRRGNTGSPSAQLAKFFYTLENEILDVDGNYGFAPEILTKAQRLSTVESHCRILSSAFERVRDGQVLAIVSPFITLAAVESDNIIGLCRQTVSQGGRVYIIVRPPDAEEQKGALEAIAALEDAKATVRRLVGIHNKTLIVADRAIAEGSFNWLSAVRGRTKRYFNYEASYLVSGTTAQADIARAVAELNELGAGIPPNLGGGEIREPAE